MTVLMYIVACVIILSITHGHPASPREIEIMVDFFHAYPSRYLHLGEMDLLIAAAGSIPSTLSANHTREFSRGATTARGKLGTGQNDELKREVTHGNQDR
jgi:hypothetical protein